MAYSGRHLHPEINPWTISQSLSKNRISKNRHKQKSGVEFDFKRRHFEEQSFLDEKRKALETRQILINKEAESLEDEQDALDEKQRVLNKKFKAIRKKQKDLSREQKAHKKEQKIHDSLYIGDGD